ncbi:FMN-binding protein [Clostridium hydrogenum]|uniref:FMN-binding protein n=1 Tax=Clostridium hydrogenum TaxID=2855764 RepID=UPI001F490CDF|nr:FMN-binding protein [Clostridium hydrogenum]
MKKKISKIQIARFASQIIFLFLLPGLFTLSFSQVGKLYSSIIKGTFSLSSTLPFLTTMFVTMLVTIIFGRFFCGWMCAFGTMNDILYTISSKVFKIKFKVNEKTDRMLKLLKYVVLIFVLIFVWTLGSTTLNNFSPWNAFAQITNFKSAIFEYTLGFIILALIAVGAMFIERFFCRYLCPLGGIFAVVSKLRFFKINKPNDKCGKCRLCTNKCSMGIDLYKVNKVTSGECINCFKCLDVCPRKNTQLSVADENINPALASSVAIAAFAGLYATSNVVANAVTKNTTTISSSASTAKGQYKDGTYTGTGTGFQPGMNVTVTVKNNKIASIDITSTNDSAGYFDQASKVVPNEIIQAQSTKVDAVSGATRSSNGIMEAVTDALKNAKLSSSSTSSTTTASNNNSTTNSEASNNNNKESNTVNSSSSTTAPASKATNTNNTAAPSSTTNASNNAAPSTTANVSNGSSNNATAPSNTSSKYKDGTYTGVGQGFRPNLKVSVTIKNGKIANIQMLSNEDTPQFFNSAASVVPSEIVQAQSTQVDAVSGATRSSNGIMMAVSDALSNAQ